jgi:hypothetical protein
MRQPLPRNVAVIAATVFAIAVPAWQALADFGLSAAEFSNQGDSTLRAEGYAFSIWSVIYAGLVFYAVWQALPRNAESPVARAVGWPSVIGIAGCGVWILMSSLDLRWASVAVILISTAAIIVALFRGTPHGGRAALWPLGLLGGWLTAASALNILTVATAEGLIGPAQAEPAAVGGLIGVTVVAGIVISRTRSLPYAAAVVWALIAVIVAERADSVPVAAMAAMGAAFIVGLTLVISRRRS